MTLTDIKRRYPRLIRSLQWLAILSESEAAACIRDYKAGLSFSGEAVNHFGGTRPLITRAASGHVRWTVASYVPANYRSLGG